MSIQKSLDGTDTRTQQKIQVCTSFRRKLDNDVLVTATEHTVK